MDHPHSHNQIHNCCLLSRLLPTSVVPHVMVKSAHLFSFLRLSFLCYTAASHQLPVLYSSFPLASCFIYGGFITVLYLHFLNPVYIQLPSFFQITNLTVFFSHLKSFSFFSLLTRQIQISKPESTYPTVFPFSLAKGHMTSQIHSEIYTFLSLPMIFLFPGLASPLCVCLPHKY